MFFCAQPDKFFPFTQIDVVQFPDGLGGDNIIENTFKGPIHHQLREALQFIKNSIVRKKIVTKAQIYRAVARSTAIETGVSVQKIEQQLKQNQAQAKAVGLAR